MPPKEKYKTNWENLKDKISGNLSDPPVGMTFRKLADQSKGDRVPRWNPETGEKFLWNPATERAEPWPTLGVMIEGTIPQSVIMPMSTVMAAIGDKPPWMVLEKMRPVYKHGGPAANPLAVTHTFIHGDFLTIKTMEGDVKYRIVHNPDKYADETQPGMARLDWFYLLELESVDG